MYTWNLKQIISFIGSLHVFDKIYVELVTDLKL